MFSLFKKKPQLIGRDCVWFSKESKYKGIIKLISSMPQDDICIIMSSFRDTIDFAHGKFVGAGFRVTELSTLSYATRGQAFNLFDLKQLNMGIVSKPGFHTNNVSIIFLEHYPLRAKDLIINDRIINIFPNADISYHLSFDEPLLNLFGSERLKQLLERLGMSEDEMIEHAMISTSIKNAMEKVQSQLVMEHPSDSEANWYRTNYRSNG